MFQISYTEALSIPVKIIKRDLQMLNFEEEVKKWQDTPAENPSQNVPTK